MGIFGRSKIAVDAVNSPSWQALRAVNPEVPPLDGWTVERTLDLAETPSGMRIEIWTDLRGAPENIDFAASLIADDGSAAETVFGGSIDGSGFVRVHALETTTSPGGGFPPWRNVAQWSEFAAFSWRGVFRARAERAERGGERSPDRYYSDEDEALSRFLDANRSLGPRLDSWRVLDRMPFTREEGGPMVEVWVAAVASGPISYPILAAGYRPDGTIAAIATLETMPSTHGDCFLGLFAEGEPHTNLGEYGEDINDPARFVEIAFELLEPFLARVPGNAPPPPPPPAGPPPPPGG